MYIMYVEVEPLDVVVDFIIPIKIKFVNLLSFGRSVYWRRSTDVRNKLSDPGYGLNTRLT